jgi:hypothetical protein
VCTGATGNGLHKHVIGEGLSRSHAIEFEIGGGADDGGGQHIVVRRQNTIALQMTTQLGPHCATAHVRETQQCEQRSAIGSVGMFVTRAHEDRVVRPLCARVHTLRLQF